MMYAENAPYWQTTVDPYKSQGEVMALLRKFGARNIAFMEGETERGPAYAFRFEFKGKSIDFISELDISEIKSMLLPISSFMIGSGGA